LAQLSAELISKYEACQSRQQIRVVAGESLTGGIQYFDMPFELTQCKRAHLKKRIGFCDGIANERELLSICSMIKHSDMQNLFTSTGERKLALMNSNRQYDSLTSEILGEALTVKLDLMKERIKSYVETTFLRNCKYLEIAEAGSILSWLSTPTVTDKDLPKYR
jgi:hypothetical protein